MNSTQYQIDYKRIYYIICALSTLFALFAILVSILIMVIVRISKHRLHTLRHLLMCNTCIASIIYCIVQPMNYIILIFFPDVTSVTFCRWRAYLAYISCCAMCYSFLIQAISRLFISLFSRKYKSLLTFKMHYILISIQWTLSLIMPLPAIITKDIVFIPGQLCWVQLRNLIHITYAFIAYYSIPVISTCIIYAFIYIEVKQKNRGAVTLVRLIHGDKRDVELLRNIVILLTIYLLGGLPILLYLLSARIELYFISIVSVSFAVTVEKFCTIALDQELRNAITQSFTRNTRISPFDLKQTTTRNHEQIWHI